jgi:hypothetical protein
MRRPAAIAAGLLAAATAGVVATVAVRGGQAPSSMSAAPPVTTATVLRTNLATTVLTAGTLGYAATNPVLRVTVTLPTAPLAIAGARPEPAVRTPPPAPPSSRPSRRPATWTSPNAAATP